MDEEVNIDMPAALAQMNEGFEEGEPEGGEPPPSASPPPAAPEAWRTPPNSWKRDLHEHYGKLDPSVMQYIHEREGQFVSGLRDYKDRYARFEDLEKHYKPWLDHYKLKMPEVTQRMIEAHLALSYAPEEQKRQYLQKMVEDYKLAPMLQQLLGGGTAAAPSDSAALQSVIASAIAPLQTRIQAFEQSAQERELGEIGATIDKFVADPQNKYAAEVLEDMTKLFQGGMAATLKEAYEQALYLNPLVRAKVIQEEIQKAAAPKTSAPKVVRPGSSAPASTKPSGEETVDLETSMRETLQAIKSR